METIVLAKILTIHTVVYGILSTLIAVAILNKSKLPNFPHMFWAVPVSWVCLMIAFWLFGALFKVVAGILIVVGIIAVFAIYSKKPST